MQSRVIIIIIPAPHIYQYEFEDFISGSILFSEKTKLVYHLRNNIFIFQSKNIVVF